MIAALMTQSGYLLLGLTAVVAALAAALTFAVLKLFSAARALTRQGRSSGGEAALLTGAMEEALRSLRAQEQAMKARAEASERLSEEIVASLTSGLLVVDGSGVVRILNPTGRRLLGLSEGESGRPYRDVLAGAPDLIALVGECLVSARPAVRRTVRAPGSAGAAHLGLTISPIKDEGGRAYGAICLFTDLSEIKDLEDQLRLKDSLARLGELTAGIAHEFRNGLATIHGYGRLLDLDRLPEDFQKYVKGIRAETEALGQVVTNFLNFAKPTELTLVPVDMAAVVTRAADDIRPEVQRHGGDLLVHGSFAWIAGDDVLLRQAVSNLCRNALEACVEAGVVPHIAIEGTPDQEQKMLRVTVTDNGPGLSPGVEQEMFRPFFTTKDRGTGLGLALVQKIIVTHNGRVTAVPRTAGGTRIAVTLPLAEG